MRGLPDDPRLTAGIDLLRRAGMRTFQLRYSDDEQPIVWMAVAELSLKAGPGGKLRPVAKDGRQHFEAAAALDPVTATLKLAEQMLDGGQCVHCDRPTGLLPELEPPPVPTLLEAAVCWYVFDAELGKFVRGCERTDGA